MAPLPIVSGDECIAALRRFGYEVARQSGSHVRLVYPGRSPVTVPRHAWPFVDTEVFMLVR
jgi:predicted RNA binding protein YcfA (HicA-like mRNA interferase family)